MRSSVDWTHNQLIESNPEIVGINVQILFDDRKTNENSLIPVLSIRTSVFPQFRNVRKMYMYLDIPFRLSRPFISEKS